jgi:hypothetical protein
MSWREDTPQPVQNDLDKLVDNALTAARDLLDHQRGEMYPFAVGLRADGTSELVSGLAGPGEHAAAVLELLYESVAAMRDAFTAVAFVAAVESDDGEAVRAEVEHRDGGPALAVFLPFRRRRFRGVEYGSLHASWSDRRLWPQPD